MVITIDRDKIQSLVDKYGVVVPRYTSYPTAPEWTDEFSQEKFETAIAKSNKTKNNYAIYLHLPFCESQCYFCGCNVVISPQHGIEKTYLNSLKDEISYYAELIDSNRKLVQMAWGGGTPTYLSPEQILDLNNHLRKSFNMFAPESLSSIAGQARDLLATKDDVVLNEHEYAVEIDPRVTSKEHLEALYQSGINRLSLGVQDFNIQTQEAINRVQSFESTARLMQEARDIGFSSINIDLIYGLPYQNLERFQETIKRVQELSPERIALFNYAHIPSMFPHQAKYIDDNSLPDQETKIQIFNSAVEELTSFDYEYIGLDHFAKPGDSLALAQKQRTLYRNFQGYTTHAGCDLFGFGISSISSVQNIYKQNPKKLNDYYDDPFLGAKFKDCSKEDIERRTIIHHIMCNGYIELDLNQHHEEFLMMEDFFNDKLATWDYIKFFDSNENSSSRYIAIELTDLGRFFARNIASVFDTYIKKEKGHKIFSKSL